MQNPLKKRLVLCAGVAALTLSSAVHARQSEPLSIDALEGRISELSSNAIPDDEEAPLLESLEGAIGTLGQVEEARARAAQFDVEAAEAPALIESFRNELATPNTELQVTPLPDASLQDLESSLQQAEAEVSSSAGRLEEFESLERHRTGRLAEIPKLLAAEQHALVQAQESLAATAISTETEARRVHRLAEIEKHTALILEWQAERKSYEACRELLPLRQDRALWRKAQAEKAVAGWKKLVEARRTADAEAAALQAHRQFEETILQFPALKKLAASNQKLAALRSGEDGLPNRISQASAELEATRALLVETQSRFDSAKERIVAGGLTEAMGQILRLDHEWLPGTGDLRAQAAVRDKQLSEAQLEGIKLADEKAQDQDFSSSIEELLEQVNVESPSEQFSERARSLMQTRGDAEDAAIEDIETLDEIFYEHRVLTDELIEAVSSYRLYVEKRILWVRSSPRNPLESIAVLPDRLEEVWLEVASVFSLQLPVIAFKKRATTCFFLGLTILLLVVGRGFLKRKRAEMCSLVRSYHTDRYTHTLRALLHTILLALMLPLLAWTAGWLLGFSPYELGRSVGTGLRDVALVWLVICFFRGLLDEKSVGHSHFKWQSKRLAVGRRELRWFGPVAVVFGFVAHTLDLHGNDRWSETVGRAAFMVLMTLLALFFHRVLRASSPLWSGDSKGGKSMFVRARRLWAFMANGLSVGLGALAATGYYYTAIQFELRLIYTLAFALALVMVNAMLLRWLFMARRRLAVTQALEARAKKEEEEEEGAEGSPESGTQSIDDDKVDIPAVDAKTRQLFKSSLTMATLIGLYFMWASVLPALQGLDRVQLLPHFEVLDADVELGPEVIASSSTSPTSPQAVQTPMTLVGGQSTEPAAEPAVTSTGLPSSLTLADVLLALFVLVLTMVAAKNLPALLELSILQRLPVDSGERYAISTLVRYVILVIGVSAGSSALGIGWQNVQWLVAALTFGLAFGLQEIFANFVSGLIILLERPVRVGDIVTVNEKEGRVTQLRMRATTIQDRDRKEHLIPNKEFITGSIINWTLTDPVTRFIIKVGVAYGSDTALARKLLTEVSKSNSIVLDDPAPEAFFIGFGESSLDFELRVFLQNRDLWAPLSDQMHTAIDNAFREAGIEIAFPQRDLHVRSIVQPEGADAKPLPGLEEKR